MADIISKLYTWVTGGTGSGTEWAAEFDNIYTGLSALGAKATFVWHFHKPGSLNNSDKIMDSDLVIPHGTTLTITKIKGVQRGGDGAFVGGDVKLQTSAATGGVFSDVANFTLNIPADDPSIDTVVSNDPANVVLTSGQVLRCTWYNSGGETLKDTTVTVCGFLTIE